MLLGVSTDSENAVRLLDAFEGTYEGALQHYLGCEVTRDMEKGTTYLSQSHYAEEILRTDNFWNAIYIYVYIHIYMWERIRPLCQIGFGPVRN